MFSNNSSVIFIPFYWAHPLHMDLRPFERAHFDDVPDYIERLKTFEGYTAMHAGEMVCCFGVNELWPGVCEAWMLTAYQIERTPISLTRGAIRYFNHIAIEKRLHRLQITVDTRNTLATHWAKVLKFKPEGVMRYYGPNQNDYVMYARYYGRSIQNPEATSA